MTSASQCASSRSRARCCTARTRSSSPGTASEVTPVRSVDRITIGRGRRGPITEQVQRRFLDVVNGRVDDTHGWLTHVRDHVKSRRRGTRVRPSEPVAEHVIPSERSESRIGVPVEGPLRRRFARLRGRRLGTARTDRRCCTTRSIPGPVDRVHFEDEQRRYRRKSWRFSVFAAFAARARPASPPASS